MILTYTGRVFDYENITKESIDIEDMVVALTRINRFMGHTSRPYSVAEHSILCYELAMDMDYSEREKLLVLIHDFTEAYCGDVNTSLKNYLPKYKEIEKEIEYAIYDYLKIQPPNEEEHEKIKKADFTALAIEMDSLTSHNWKEIDEDIISKIDESFVHSRKLNKYHQPSEKSSINIIVGLLEVLLKLEEDSKEDNKDG